MRFSKAVEKAPTHKTLEVCSRKWERFDAELAAAFDSHLARCFAGSRCTEMLFSGRGLDVSGHAALWFVLQKYVVEAGVLSAGRIVEAHWTHFLRRSWSFP